ncbi:MAG: hypothetical protein AB8V79_01555 [Candidatus Midichloria sp.]
MAQAPEIDLTEIDLNTAFIYFIANHLMIGIKGIVITGLLAVIMSTAYSWLNTKSVLCSRDIVGKLISLTEKQALITARLSTFVIAIFAILLSLWERGVMELEWLSSNFWMPIMIVPLAARFLRFWTNSASFIASVTLAIIFTCVTGYIVGDFATISLMVGMIGGSIGLFGMHYWQRHQGLGPAKKHIEREAMKKSNKVVTASSREQIEEWLKA